MVGLMEASTNHNRMKATLESTKIELEKERKEKAEIEKSLREKRDNTEKNRNLLMENQKLREQLKKAQEQAEKDRKEANVRHEQAAATRKELDLSIARLKQEIENLEKDKNSQKANYEQKVHSLEVANRDAKTEYEFIKMTTPQDKDRKIEALKRGINEMNVTLENKNKVIESSCTLWNSFGSHFLISEWNFAYDSSN